MAAPPVRHSKYGVLNWFIRTPWTRQHQLFGDGSQQRDYNYVDDVTDAFCGGAQQAAATAKPQPGSAIRARCAGHEAVLRFAGAGA